MNSNLFNVSANYVGILMWGSLGSNIGQFNSPFGLAVDSKINLLYVADSGNDRIQVFRMFSDICPPHEKKLISGVCFVTKWGTTGMADGQFAHPNDVDIDSNGNVFVADQLNNRIQVFKLVNPCPANSQTVASGVCYVTKWGLYAPKHVVVGPQDHIFVTDLVAQRVQEFQLANPCPSGTTPVNAGVGVCLVKDWQPFGAHTQGSYSLDIAFDSKGNLFLADGINNQVQIYRLRDPCPSGTTQVDIGVCYSGKWVNYGSGPGQFNYPHSITVDSSDNVFVSNVNDGRIQKFNLQKPLCQSVMIRIFKFVCVTEWGTLNVGSGPPVIGQFGWPSSVDVDSSGRVYVSDISYNYNNIQVFEK